MSNKANLLRWALLIAPVTVITAILLVLNTCHPASNGAVIVTDVSQIPFDLRGVLTLESFALADSVIVSGVDVMVSADRLLVEGRTLPSQTLNLIASKNATITLMRQMPNTIKLQSKNGSLTTSIEARTAGRGFDLDFVTSRGSIDVWLLFASPEGERGASVRLLLRGYRTDTGTDPKHIDIASTTGPATVHFTASRANARVFSVHYTAPDTTAIEIFPRSAGRELTLASRPSYRVLGRTRIIVAGRSIGDFEDSSFEFTESKLSLSKPLIASRFGLSTRFSGHISQAFSLNGEDREPLLPNSLSYIKPMAVIIFTAIAYAIDKIITVSKFVRSGE